MLVQRFVLNDLYTNTYIVGEPDGEVFVLDPGAETMDEVISYIEDHHLRVKWIINTHAHFDHVLGNESMRTHFGVPLLLHESELDGLLTVPDITHRIYGKAVRTNEPDHFLCEGDILSLGAYDFRILVTPGHSPGGVCLYEAQEKVLFSGDTIFAGTIGRTDLPGGNAVELINSLKDKLWPLPDDVLIYPGHDEYSTIGEERAHNPFFYF